MVRRVVITGIGAITSLGNNAMSNWQNILASKSGISNITHFDTSRFNCRIASSVIDLPADIISDRELRKMDRFIAFGIIAAHEAIKDSGWHPETEQQKERTGVIVGSGIGGISTIERTAYDLKDSAHAKVSPYFIPASLVNLLSGHISINHGFSGPNHAVCTACATGTHAIGDAFRIIKYGDADIMVAGGAEAPITPVAVAGFAALRALTVSFNDNPTQSSRPWDVDRSGFVMGEGSGILVLEEYEHAKARGAKIYAEVIGYGMSGDAYHITAPNGKGAMKAMQNALKDANISVDEINYINAHGTSTPLGDEIELKVIQELFSANTNLKMSSTKSSIGHLLGAAGSVEAIFTALAIRDQIAPPTINLYNQIEDAKIDLVPLVPKEINIKYAMSNSFGFGGTNASLILKKI
ncbi:MAG: beta-ketoacyl-ACP synthase II [Rickettsiaceae bacterium]|nr:beta-ketoacyl-ACP synthase II [Rickettsiaceae bacterium]